MKLTRDRLKEIIKEELEEVWNPDESPTAAGVPNLPTPDQQPKVDSQVSQKLLRMADEIYNTSQLKEMDPKGKLIKSFGNLVSAIERKDQNLIKMYMKMLEDEAKKDIQQPVKK
jgi:hypothetical protein